MSNSTNWRQVWEGKSGESVSDFELDRGRYPHEQEIENLSEKELVNFIDPQPFETVLDAGCGTGVNIFRLHSKVKNIIGIDYACGSLKRCQKRVQSHDITNADLCVAAVSAIPLPDCSVDKILCLSVLQYLDDWEVRQTLREFVRLLTPSGVIILHVKNLSSLYWSMLWTAKKLKALLGKSTRIEHVRSFQWYVNELAFLNCHVLDYNSFNVLTLEGTPKSLLSVLHRFEWRHHNCALFRFPFIRRHGAELKIKAKVDGHPVEPD